MAQSLFFYTLFLMTATFAAKTAARQFTTPEIGLDPSGPPAKHASAKEAASSSSSSSRVKVLPRVPRMDVARYVNNRYRIAVGDYLKYSWGPASTNADMNATFWAALTHLNQVYPAFQMRQRFTTFRNRSLHTTWPSIVVPRNRSIFINSRAYAWTNDYDINGRNTSELVTDEQAKQAVAKSYASESTDITVSINGVYLGGGLKITATKSFSFNWPVNDMPFVWPGLAVSRDIWTMGEGVLINKANPGVHKLEFNYKSLPGYTSFVLLVVQ